MSELTGQMVVSARSLNCQIATFVYQLDDGQETISTDIVPFLPRQGDKLIDLDEKQWICESVEFGSSLIALPDGSKCVLHSPTVYAKRLADKTFYTPPMRR